jgi:hypothetical protein
MGASDSFEFSVPRLLCGVKDQRHIHHDVDKQRLRANERGQVLPLGLKPLGERSPRFDQHSL